MSNTSPFPRRLLKARTELGISQRELGIRIGIEESSASARMNHYEKGRHSPDYATIERIAKQLGKPIAYFFSEKDSLAELISMLDNVAEEKRQELISQLKKAP